jgi:glycopeptide antibiotics resistance protein
LLFFAARGVFIDEPTFASISRLLGVTKEGVYFLAKTLFNPTSFFPFAFFSNLWGEGFL